MKWCKDVVHTFLNSTGHGYDALAILLLHKKEHLVVLRKSLDSLERRKIFCLCQKLKPFP
jgi:hypothetical protein